MVQAAGTLRAEPVHAASGDRNAMINKHQIKEISDFLAAFLEIFDTLMAVHDHQNSQEPAVNALSGQFVFRVTGAIHGFLVATSTQPPEKRSLGFHATPGLYKELMTSYYRKTRTHKALSAFRIDPAEARSIDHLLYITRKAEPQMTMRIHTKHYVMELYAFTQANQNGRV